MGGVNSVVVEVSKVLEFAGVNAAKISGAVEDSDDIPAGQMVFVFDRV